MWLSKQSNAKYVQLNRLCRRIICECIHPFCRLVQVHFINVIWNNKQCLYVSFEQKLIANSRAWKCWLLHPTMENRRIQSTSIFQFVCDSRRSSTQRQHLSTRVRNRPRILFIRWIHHIQGMRSGYLLIHLMRRLWLCSLFVERQLYAK